MTAFRDITPIPAARLLSLLFGEEGEGLMVSAALKLDILREVAIHDGEWYWYQLDRRLLGNHPEAPGGLMVAVKELAAEGLIEIRPNSTLGDIPRYWLTKAGRIRLIEQKHAEQNAAADRPRE